MLPVAAISERLRFLVVGAFNTVFGYLVFTGLYLGLHEHLHYLLIGLIAHFIAVVNAFVLHRKIVFRSRLPVLASFIRFNLSTATALIFSLSCMALLVETLAIPPLIAQAIVTSLSVVLSYVLHRNYSFRA